MTGSLFNVWDDDQPDAGWLLRPMPLPIPELLKPLPGGGLFGMLPLVNDSAPAAEDDSAISASPYQLAMDAVRPRPTTPAQTPEERARVIMGETAGLYPQSLDPAKPPHYPWNWVEGSEDELALARKYVGIVAGRNANTRPATPYLNNPLERDAWEAATDAANEAHKSPDDLDPRITNFYIRHENDGRDPWPNLQPYFAVGPFRNVGGQGSTGPSNNTFIEFYGRK